MKIMGCNAIYSNESESDIILKLMTKEAYERIVHRRKPNPYIILINGNLVADIGCGAGQNCLMFNKNMFYV